MQTGLPGSEDNTSKLSYSRSTSTAEEQHEVSPFTYAYERSEEEHQKNTMRHADVIHQLLEHLHLQKYQPAFQHHGFETLQSLLDAQDEDYQFMGVKRGHQRIIQRGVADWLEIPFSDVIAAAKADEDDSKPEGAALARAPVERASHIITPPATASTDHPEEYYSIAQYPPRPYTMSRIEDKSGAIVLPPIMSDAREVRDARARAHSSHASMPYFYPGDAYYAYGQARAPGFFPHNPSPLVGAAPGTYSTLRPLTSVALNPAMPPPHTGARPLTSLPSQTMSPQRQLSIKRPHTSETARGSLKPLGPDTYPSVGSKRRYRRHPKPDVNAPEKPPSAYVQFANGIRETMKGKSFSEIAKTVGERWQALDKETKDAYEASATQAKERYNIALARYKSTPEYEKYQAYLEEFKERYRTSAISLPRVRKYDEEIQFPELVRPGASPDKHSFEDAEESDISDDDARSIKKHKDADAPVHAQARPV